MHTYLMRATRFKIHLKQGMRLELFQDLVMRNRRLSHGINRHFYTLCRMTTDG